EVEPVDVEIAITIEQQERGLEVISGVLQRDRAHIQGGAARQSLAPLRRIGFEVPCRLLCQHKQIAKTETQAVVEQIVEKRAPPDVAQRRCVLLVPPRG